MLNPHDDLHGRATALQQERSSARRFTSDLVLVELFNMACEYGEQTRQLVVRFEQSLRDDPLVTVVPFSSARLQQAIRFYQKYRDKAWSLTDCDSILVMRQNGLAEALTFDHHFVQAGFTALMRTG